MEPHQTKTSVHQRAQVKRQMAEQEETSVNLISD